MLFLYPAFTPEAEPGKLSFASVVFFLLYK